MAETLARRVVSTKGMARYHVRDYLTETANAISGISAQNEKRDQSDADKDSATHTHKSGNATMTGSEKGNNKKVVTADLPTMEPIPKPRLFVAACNRAKEKFISTGIHTCMPDECKRCSLRVFAKCKRTWLKHMAMAGAVAKSERIAMAKYRRRAEIPQEETTVTEAQIIAADVLRGVVSENYKLFSENGVLICEGADEIRAYIEYMTEE